METSDAFEIYASLKAHFNPNGKYDYFRYGGKLGNFDINNVKHKRLFHRLSNKYAIKMDMEDYCVGNLMFGESEYIWEFQEEPMRLYQKNKASILYHLDRDVTWIINNLKDNGLLWKDLYEFDNKYKIPPLYRMARQECIELETLVILDDLAPCIEYWNETITLCFPERLEWPDFFMKLKKYKPFLKINKAKSKKIIGGLLKDW